MPKSAFVEYFEAQTKRLILYTLAFVFAKFVTQSLEKSTDPYVKTVGMSWLRTLIIFLLILATFACIAYLDPLMPDEAA